MAFRADNAVEFAKISYEIFKEKMQVPFENAKRARIDFLQAQPAFNKMCDYKVEYLIHEMFKLKFRKNEIIFEEGK